MSVKLHTLSNGFQIVTEHMPGFQSASLGIWIKAGGRHERAEENGIAHFLEHMAFKGTKTRSALQIAEMIEDVGGYINAYTSREVTAYYTRVLKEDVALSINLLFDILQNSIFEEKEIEIERGVILQEIGQSLDTPDDVIFDWLQDISYPDQALGRTILGPSERVKNFSRANLIDFIAQHYHPERMILSAAGGIDHDEIIRLAEASFGTLPMRAAPENFGKAKFVGGEFRKEKSLEQAHVALAFESPSYRDDDIYTAQIYSVALGGGMSSRLFQEIREKRGLCYTIFAQAGAFSDSGMMTIYAGTSEAQVPDLMALTFDELRRAAEDMSSNELERARAQMKAGMLMGLESASNRAERLARQVQVWGYVPELEETVAKIENVTLDRLRSFSEHIASKAPAALALYGPIQNAPTLNEIQQNSAA
ncbi:MAG: pitrilysin family protein [Proteobacteria bacterium]|nr:pitrilysin family protein [Pseudomonadota bacterium]MDA0852408.1 pitrilysin family protein [Pseudomonadota bacterium]MDA1295494.1 pitrilysin family protein [Pseudomonadota bacterium]